MSIEEILGKMSENSSKSSELSKKLKIKSELSNINRRCESAENDLIDYATREMQYILNNCRYNYQMNGEVQFELSEEEKIAMLKSLKAGILQALENTKKTAEELFSDIELDKEEKEEEKKPEEKPEEKQVEIQVQAQPVAATQFPNFGY